MEATVQTRSTDNAESPSPEFLSDPNDIDRMLARDRYIKAVNALKQAIEKHRGSYGSYDFVELSGEPEGFEFRQKINVVLESLRTGSAEPKKWLKAKKVTEYIFMATSPFAKNFLTIAKEGQSVCTTIAFN